MSIIFTYFSMSHCYHIIAFFTKKIFLNFFLNFHFMDFVELFLNQYYTRKKLVLNFSIRTSSRTLKILLQFQDYNQSDLSLFLSDFPLKLYTKTILFSSILNQIHAYPLSKSICFGFTNFLFLTKILPQILYNLSERKK